MNIVKVCTKCKRLKPLDKFNKQHCMKSGYRSHCRECQKLYSLKNREHELANKKKYYRENPEKFKLYRELNKEKHNLKCREWNQKNKEKRKEYSKNRYKANKKYFENRYKENKEEHILRSIKWQKDNPDKAKEIKKGVHARASQRPKYLLNNRMRMGVYKSLRGLSKNGAKWESLVGYNVEELKVHLEKQFTDEMSWNSFINGKIHIDHIKPINSFNFDSTDSQEFKDCWSL